ncbi:unnamed protein product [Rhodiola kirilowii]
MAFGTVVSEEASGGSGEIGVVEKQKWAETKVYLRRLSKGVKSNDAPSEPKTTITETAIGNDEGNHNQTNKSNLFEDSSHVGVSVQERNHIGEARNLLDGNGVIDCEKAGSVPSSVEIPVENGNFKQIQPETDVKVFPDKALSSGHIEEGDHTNNHLDGIGVIESEKAVSCLSSTKIPAENGNLRQIQPENSVKVTSDKALSSAHIEEGNHANNHLDGNGVSESVKAVSSPSSVEIPAEDGNLRQIQSETAVRVTSDKALSSYHIEEGNRSNNHLDENGVIESEKPVSGPSSVEIPAENGNLRQIQPETAVEVIADKTSSSCHIHEGKHAINHLDGNGVIEREKAVSHPSSVDIPAENGNVRHIQPEISVEVIPDEALTSVHIEVGTHANNHLDEDGVIDSEKVASGPSTVEIHADNGNLKRIQPETTVEVILEKALTSVHSEEGNHATNHLDENGVIESEQVASGPSSVEIPADNGNLKQIQPETTVEVISDKAMSTVRSDGVVPISVDQPVINDAPRPSFAALESKIKINLSSTSKPKLRVLKRKCEDELYRVRKVAKTMEGRGDEMAPEFAHPVVNNGLVVNGARGNGLATQVYSGTRSLGHVPYKPNIRPFNQLRVSVVENGLGMVDSIEREKRTPKVNQFYRNSEFLLAKDKFPPTESSKKSKSNGKKSSGGDFGFGVGSKVYKSCITLLEKLMKHKHGWVFNTPVDAKGLGLHDYFLIIKNPMDLGTVKARLSTYWYKSPMEFAEDVRLTFHNAMLYNPKGQDVHIMAETLLKIFENRWPDIEFKYLRELRMTVDHDLGLPTPQSRRSNPFQSPAYPPVETRMFNRSESMPHPVNPKPRTLTHAPSFRTPALKKPKAKDVNKREMTYDEKQKLSTNLQSLPPEKLDGVIQIIKRRSSALSQNDDEIEVDIDSVDTETLWELDRYVTNYKKSLSKNRRKAELANQMRADARQAIEKTTNPLQSAALAENTAGNGNATLLSPARGNGPAANASGSSSSSSSSSSGSSSTDSDSDSSSDESDAGQSPRA